MTSRECFENKWFYMKYIGKYLLVGKYTFGPWFSPVTPVSSPNITDRNDITVILLKVALNTITLPYRIHLR